MKILIPVLPTRKGLAMAQHFGRAPKFAMFDTDRIDKPDILDNPVPPAMKEGSGRGNILFEFFGKLRFDAVIVKTIGSGAFSKLKLSSIKVYSTDSNLAEDAVKDLMNNEIKELEAPNE